MKPVLKMIAITEDRNHCSFFHESSSPIARLQFERLKLLHNNLRDGVKNVNIQIYLSKYFPLGTRRCFDFESESKTLIQRHNNVVCQPKIITMTAVAS